MTYEQFVALVKDVGFPVFVAGYLLLRMERILRDTRLTLHELVKQVTRLVDRLAPPL